MKKSMFLSAMSVCALAFFVMTLASCVSKSNEVEEQEGVNPESLKSAYIAQLDKWAADYPDSTTAQFCGYFVYDLDGDDVPELWVEGGTCEADRKLSIYSYGEDGIFPLYEEGAPHSTLYQGDNYVLYLSANGGEVLENKLTYEGDSINVEKVYEGAMDSEAGFSDPTELRIELTPYSDHELIDNLFKENLKEEEEVEEVE